MPITLSDLLKTIFSFIIFLIGSIILTIIGFFLLTIGGQTKKHKLIYHRCICRTFRILSKVMMQVPCEVRNPIRKLLKDRELSFLTISHIWIYSIR